MSKKNFFGINWFKIFFSKIGRFIYQTVQNKIFSMNIGLLGISKKNRLRNTAFF